MTRLVHASGIDAAAVTAGTLDIARIPVGTSSTTVAAGNDSRLADTRTPTDGSVTNAKVSASAAIALSKLAAGYVQGSKNGVVTTITLWAGTEAQYNTATSNGTAEDPNTIYLRGA